MPEKNNSRSEPVIQAFLSRRSNGFKKDLELSLKIVWIIYSIIIFTIVCMTLFSPDLLLMLSPVCISKSLYGGECFMCGMTRAFVEISNGNFYNANLLNGLSIYLFSIFILNELIFLGYVSNKFIKIFISKNTFQIPINLKTKQ